MSLDKTQVKLFPNFTRHYYCHTYPNTGKCAEKKDSLPLARVVSFPPLTHHGRIYIVHHPSSLFQCEKTCMETSLRHVKESFWENYLALEIWFLTAKLENCGHSKRIRRNCRIPGPLEAIPL